jgi:hypothetical protein
VQSAWAWTAGAAAGYPGGRTCGKTCGRPLGRLLERLLGRLLGSLQERLQAVERALMLQYVVVCVTVGLGPVTHRSVPNE